MAGIVTEPLPLMLVPVIASDTHWNGEEPVGVPIVAHCSSRDVQYRLVS